MTTSPFGVPRPGAGSRGSGPLSTRRLIHAQKRMIEDMEQRRQLLEERLADLQTHEEDEVAALSLAELQAQAELLEAQLAIYAEEIGQLYHAASEQAREIGSRTAEATRAALALLQQLDSDTYLHSQRVARYAEIIAQRLELPPEDHQGVILGALLHDIGFIGRPQLIRGASEKTVGLALYRQHPVIGARMLRDVAVLQPAVPVVLYHHERPDGLGFPRGLNGLQIPLHARIVAVANAYDAMVTRRPFSQHAQEGVVLLNLRRNAGTRYDRHAVEALIRARYEKSWGEWELRDPPEQ